jgi:hypothetical protein
VGSGGVHGIVGAGKWEMVIGHVDCIALFVSG